MNVFDLARAPPPPPADLFMAYALFGSYARAGKLTADWRMVQLAVRAPVPQHLQILGFRRRPLAIRPDHEVDRIVHVGHKDPVLGLAGFELILLGLLGFYFLAHG